MIDNALVEMLVNANKKLTDSVDGLQARVEELEDRLTVTEEALEAERATSKRYEAEANEARALAQAVRDYLSWKESPPLGMDLGVYRGIESSFRRTLEETLRRLEG